MLSQIPSPVAAHLSASVRRSAARPRNPLLERAGDYPDLINLGRGDPDLPTPAHIIAAGKGALDDGYTHYTHAHGLPALRSAIAAKLARRNGLSVDPDRQVLVTTGAQEAVFLALHALLDAGDEVLVPDPHYTSYDLAAAAAGGRVVSVPTHREHAFVVRPEDVECRISPRTKALAIVSPNNPTGAVYPLETLTKLAELAVRHDLVVISDEIYELLTFAGVDHVSTAALPEMQDRTITINGFSKAYSMTGWRVGYMVGPPDFISAVSALRHTLTICAPAFAQKAAVAALTGSQDCVAELVRTYDERRHLFVRGLRTIGLDAFDPLGTFFLFADIRQLGVSSEEYAARVLDDAHVLIYPGSYFGEAGEGFLRVSLVAPAERLAEALTRMAAVSIPRPSPGGGE